MKLAEELTKEILIDEYFQSLFIKAEKVAALDLFFSDLREVLSNKEYSDLIRFSDILSHSADPEAKNKSYKILALLAKSFGTTEKFKIFAGAILAKLGNFPAIKFLKDNYEYTGTLPIEREIEKRIKSDSQKTSNGKYIFTDAQYKIRTNLDTYDYFSFSGPTSIGKSFILKDFIRHLLSQRGLIDNSVIVILVPTRALISQVIVELRNEIDKKVVNIGSLPVFSTYSLRKYKQHIFVFTPERLLSYVSTNSLAVKYLFVDEAQKIVAENDPRSSLYYHAIYETSRRFATKIIFASPNIPNPDIFLKLFEKDDRGYCAVNEQTVAQNRYFVDFINNKLFFFSDFGEEYIIDDFPSSKNPNALILNLGSEVNNIVYCNGISETVKRAKDFAQNLQNINNEGVNEVINFVSEYVHKDYYLIECLKKGVAFHHGRMPQRIRRKIEDLFADKNSPLRYIFCTSTLLEGVNLPAKNIFVFNDNHGTHPFSKIDFENLIGRAGRLTKEFSGNVICIKDDERRWKEESSLLKREKLNKVDSFLISKGRRQTKEFLNMGKSLINEPLSSSLRVGEQENINHYASIVLLHHIENEGSILKAGFLERNKNAQEILEKTRRSNKVPAEILRLSSTIKPFYQNKALNYINRKQSEAVLTIDSDDNDVIVKSLIILYEIYGWENEESSGRDCLIPSGLIKVGYGKSKLKYWAMLLRNWTKSEPLSRLISFSIQFHFQKGDIWFYDNGRNIQEAFVGNQKQINIIIEQIMSDIENGLRFKIEKYLRNYYLLLKHVLGEENAGQDWSEFVEYGTIDKKIIELQRLGFSRGASKYLLTNHSGEFSFNDYDQLLELNEAALLTALDKKNEHYEEIYELFK